MKTSNHITPPMKLSPKDEELLNSKAGLRHLFAQKNINLENVLKKTKVSHRLEELEAELIKLQSWVIENNKKVVVVFEGRDVAGKGGAIRQIIHRLNPRHYRSVALNKPTKDQQGQWYFQRYVTRLPKPSEIVFFDRSWYNRAMVEPVNGFCTQEEYDIFMAHVNEFEDMIIQSKTYLIKFYFSITKAEQARRFDLIASDELKRWKITAVDKEAQKLWKDYTLYKKKMIQQTDTKIAPWVIIDANDNMSARIKAIEHLLGAIPYH